MTHGSSDRRAITSLVQMTCTLVAGAALLSGCSSSEEPVAGAKSAAAVAAARKPSPDADLVAAVPTGSDPAGASLRFELQERPALHQPFHVRVVTAPSKDVEKLQVSFEATAGLQLTDPSPLFEVANVAAGEAQERVLTLRANSEGAFEIRAKVTTEGLLANASATYAIPVLVMPAAAPPK